MKKSRSKSYLFFLLLNLVVLSGCLDLKQVGAQKTSEGSSSSPSTGSPHQGGSNELPSVSPIVVDPVLQKSEVGSRGAMVPRQYMKQIFKDLFSASDFTSHPLQDPDLSLVMSAGITSQIHNLVITQTGSFGPSCNFYGSYQTLSTTAAQDCGGASGDAVSNAISDFAAQSSTVRHLNTAKVCEMILGGETVRVTRIGSTNTDDINFERSIYAAAKNISGSTVYLSPKITSNVISGYELAELDENAITALYGLFNRSREISAAELEIYSDFNERLKITSPPTTNVNRWRSVLLMMCESPEWTLL
ncbi:hypothetical protein AZI86_17025 [Bdellovibrio bacteriovorus]|uniref:Lipoprotein n=1 Tax=Bdellovibrio bacteriovorus TaxID=959 RepID=A0A150WEH2_BDEBC|nr:hypothetical protein [Bdellovibrio bacteriovorus]KYG61416.1 hypothetical protein AZI86_17025 [Bdellovibrio bacteriovorus]